MLLEEFLREGSRVIDATAGNGYDTLFLAEKVGMTGMVTAFDVQAEAIGATRKRLQDAGMEERVRLVQGSHGSMAEHADEGSVAVVMFNLGYLPGADHSIATGKDTIAALEAAVRLLGNGGALSVVCYPGHHGGDEEAAGVERWMTDLPSKGWRVVKYGALGTLRPSPFLLFGVKGAA